MNRITFSYPGKEFEIYEYNELEQKFVCVDIIKIGEVV